jgi:EpsG family
MWPYWFMFLLPALAAVQESGPDPLAAEAAGPPRGDRVLSALSLLLAVLVGYRFQVGGDWFNYSERLPELAGLEWSEVVVKPDPGYQLVSWFSLEMDWGLVGVNLICGAISIYGVSQFCRSLPRPRLALAVAIPYLVIVVCMGYTRQAVAIGLAMRGLVALGRKENLKFVIWVLLAATFHKTAVLLLPIAALANSRNRYWIALWVGLITFGAYVVFLQESVDDLVQNYWAAEYQSEGALVRLAMTAVPALILLLKYKQFDFGSDNETVLWRWSAGISLVLFVVVFFVPSTTALDRIGLYMIPLQLVVFSYLPGVMAKEGGSEAAWVGGILLYYGVVLFVWLNFATHAQYWLPYRFYPLEGVF